MECLSQNQSIAFQNEWNSRRDHLEKIYITYDSTNKNCQAGDLECVEIGHPKDDNGKPVLNYSIAYDHNNSEPLYCEEYPGSIVDVSQLQQILLKAKIFIEFVALIIRNRIHFLLKEQMLKTHQKENYMTAPVAIRELEKIEILRQTDGEYYQDYTVTATQKSILKAFGLSEINVRKQAVDINEDLRSCNTKEHSNGT